MTIDQKRLLELALEHLTNKRSQLDAEIQAVRAELKGSGKSAPAKNPKRRRPKLTAAERKSRSQRMKKYWAERKKKERASKGK